MFSWGSEMTVKAMAHLTFGSFKKSGALVPTLTRCNSSCKEFKKGTLILGLVLARLREAWRKARVATAPGALITYSLVILKG